MKKVILIFVMLFCVNANEPFEIQFGPNWNSIYIETLVDKLSIQRVNVDDEHCELTTNYFKKEEAPEYPIVLSKKVFNHKES